ncbi:hypothetical protein [Lysobacter sp. 22409]|uniref:hypothetical protein n=1 Tax=Lysobacter sp. 22409 TaxID=3453917 RepID=UPI003F835BE6
MLLPFGRCHHLRDGRPPPDAAAGRPLDAAYSERVSGGLGLLAPVLPVLPASMSRPQVRTDCRIDRSVFACVVVGVAELIAIGVFGLCERLDLAAARTELLTRWLLILL